MTYKLSYIITSLFLCSLFSLTAEDKYIISDFSDVSTWRIIGCKGVARGLWFAADLNLGSVPDASRDDGYAGAFKYNFSGQAPFFQAFHRYKVYKAATAYATAIEFWANPNEHPGKIRFTIHDAKGRKYDIKPVPVNENIWKKYRAEINKSTVQDYNKIEFPIRLKAVSLLMNTPGKGLFYIDDIALCGNIPKSKQLTLTPVYETLHHLPHTPITLKYRAENATPARKDCSVSINVKNYTGSTVNSSIQELSISGYQRKVLSFSLPPQPIGSYLCELTIKSDKITNKTGDWFGVFTPNNKRLNKTTMLFGINDGNLTQCDAENKLHLEWMQLMGIDINRFATAGTFLDYDMAKAEGDQGSSHIMNMFNEKNIDLCVSYIEGVPKQIRGHHTHRRVQVPKESFEKFYQHMENLGSYLNRFPNVKYLEWRNEPDISFFHGNLEGYLEELKLAKRALKATAPNLKLTTGGVCVSHPREKKNFSQRMYQEGKSLFDVACFHSHGSFKTYKKLNNKVENWLKESGQILPICNTEAGERSGYFNQDSARYQCENLVKKITFAKSRNTEFYIWFMLQDYWDMDFHADDSFGLITTENRPKPSFIAYNNLIKQLTNTSFSKKQFPLPAEVASYHFVTNDNEEDVLVCWTKEKNTQTSLQLAGTGTITHSDIFGKETLIQSDSIFPAPVIISNTPSFIRFRRNSFKRCEQKLVSFPQAIFMEENEKRFIPITIKNVFPTKRSFILSKLEDNQETILTKLTLAPNQEVAQNIFWELNNAKKRQLKVKIVDNTKEFIYPVNITKTYTIYKITANSTFPVAKIAETKPIKLDKLKDVKEMSYDPTIKGWNGANDLSANCKITHNTKNIYFYFEVKDDKHVQNDTGINIWRGDGIQIGLATTKGQHWELTMALTPKGPEAWCHISPDNKSNGPMNLPLQVKRENTKTVYMLTIPLEQLNWQYAPNTPLRFAFLVNEDDGQGRVRWLKYFNGIGGDKNPALFGHALLK